MARTLASLAGYVATTDDDGLQLHQFAPARISTRLPGGQAIEIEVETEYPREGTVRVVVGESARAPWTLTFRVPAWADGARLTVTSGGEVVQDAPAPPGPASIRRAFEQGDVVQLVLPMQPRFTAPSPQIDAVRGCLAVERGPQVYCLESLELAAGSEAPDDIAQVRLDATTPPRDDGESVRVRLRRGDAAPEFARWPYAPPAAAQDDTGDGEQPGAVDGGLDVELIPYNRWAGRGPSAMRIWLPAG